MRRAASIAALAAAVLLIASPALHLTAMLVALALTAFSLWSVRRASRAPVADRVAEAG